MHQLWQDHFIGNNLILLQRMCLRQWRLKQHEDKDHYQMRKSKDVKQIAYACIVGVLDTLQSIVPIDQSVK